jgi:hypothetical protein
MQCRPSAVRSRVDHGRSILDGYRKWVTSRRNVLLGRDRERIGIDVVVHRSDWRSRPIVTILRRRTADGTRTTPEGAELVRPARVGRCESRGRQDRDRCSRCYRLVDETAAALVPFPDVGRTARVVHWSILANDDFRNRLELVGKLLVYSLGDANNNMLESGNGLKTISHRDK